MMGSQLDWAKDNLESVHKISFTDEENKAETEAPKPTDDSVWDGVLASRCAHLEKCKQVKPGAGESQLRG